MESGLDYWGAKALLEWQVELGADEAISDGAISRYELPQKASKPIATQQPAQLKSEAIDAVSEARQMANAAQDLAGLKAALAGFEHCDLKKGARNLVFADGDPSARVMIIGEAPGRDEDREGRPFVGRAGQLLDKMLAAINMGRTVDSHVPVYITDVLPWRPPQSRDPKPEEIAMLLPFVERHVALVKPEVIVLMGDISCQAGLGKRGIMRLRGDWAEAYGTPCLPMFHPDYLLRSPHAKREAWADLLSLQARLRETT